ncbi:substrate-binding domain-containing protein [Methylomonas albis]|uniref:Quinoprotein dehydrogenase-associated putative ABC transporter substrate-binding protein n=1 Tax=Methylomonas albis TaxID=1854563 RepID=A0ABR9D2S5_9GAMM|nr:substrate-binding domain-containing protein [Methylomonas albis]MBD9357111.1 quinoprotein dehydrogenase-associated putative ABC transporter substrate-binding protein [Methylomonas albis]
MLQSSFKSPDALRIAFLAAILSFATAVAADSELRVCADPDNLPFSNQKQEGFENKIAKLLADDLGMKLNFYWQKQRQGYIRETLGAKYCDVMMGVPHGYERVLSTRPYYRSGYAFVTARGRHLAFKSFDDPRLHKLKIGLHAIGIDGSNSPPANALARRGIVENIVGYSMWGEESIDNPQGEIVSAVAKQEIDVAIVWGPIGGYFAKPFGKALVVTPAPADADMPSMPFDFDISLGVRKGEEAFAAQLEQSLTRKQREIQDILTAYNVPLIKPFLGATVSLLDRDPATSQTSLKR